MEFNKDAIFILQRLNQYGHEAYLVGGCVRDALMGWSNHDMDITTSALPNEVKQCFMNYPIIDTGIKHGTVTLLLNTIPYEITTFRIEKDYNDYRHPSTIRFTKNLEEDLKRRDFTINALCWHPSFGIIDLNNGQIDLNHKVIRAIGNANDRLQEDSLRILRALRFASCLGFTIEKETELSMIQNKELLADIAIERINQEFSKLLTGKSAYEIVEKYTEILSVFIPNLNQLKRSNAFQETLNSLKNAPLILTLRLALFIKNFQDFSLLQDLKYSNQIINRVTTLISLNKLPLESKVDLKKIMSKCSDDSLIEEFLFMKYALSNRFPIELYRNLIIDIKKNHECLTLHDCCVNGYDCLRLNVPKKEIHKVLNTILNEILEEKLNNEKSECINRIKELANR